jgi:hypothetical protein
MIDFTYGDLEPLLNKMEEKIREKIARDLERQATYAMTSNEFNFNDTAIRAKTYHHAAEIVRGKPNG